MVTAVVVTSCASPHSGRQMTRAAPAENTPFLGNRLGNRGFGNWSPESMACHHADAAAPRRLSLPRACCSLGPPDAVGLFPPNERAILIMRNRFVTQLVVPLLVGAGLFMLLHRLWPADGFFLNVSAGFVGSLVTVGYVDWILRRHDAERWQVADSRINGQLSRLASATITGVRVSFGVDFEMLHPDLDVMRKEMLRIAKEVLIPIADGKISAWDQAAWRQFAIHLRETHRECGVLLDRFGHRLTPNTVALLLDLQSQLESARGFYLLFPDVVGVDPTELAKEGRVSETLPATACTLTAQETRKVLELAIELSNATNQ